MDKEIFNKLRSYDIRIFRNQDLFEEIKKHFAKEMMWYWFL